MQVVTHYPDGLFCWIDLSTTDVEAAKSFYSQLFGWETEDRPTDMGTHYTMLQIAGKNVAGLGPLSPDMQAQGVPPFWSSYVKHSDVDAVAARAEAAGGQLLFPPMDVMSEGRMTMIQDPTGAVVGVWQPQNHTGAELVNQPNTLIWNELQTRAGDKAQAFYKAVFGWEGQADKSGYVLFSQDGRRQAGMILMDDSWGDVPSNWAVYIFVEDVESTINTAQELGGNVLVPATVAGEMGKFAVLQDPQGAVFTVMSFNGPVDPPPGY